MTFVLAFTTRDTAVLATDTRTRVGGTFTDSIGGKLRELGPGIWGAGAGLRQWTAPALDAIAACGVKSLAAVAAAVAPIAESQAIRELLAGITAEERAQLETWAGARADDGDAGAKLGQVIIVYRNAAGSYVCWSIDDTGRVQGHPRNQLYLSLPPGLEPDDVAAHVRSIWAGAPLKGKADLVHRTAALMNVAASKTDYMSDQVELVCLTPARAVLIGPSAACDLMASTAGDVSALLDVWGRSLAVWIPSYAGIGSGNGPGTRAPDTHDPALDLVINGGFELGLSRWVLDNTLVGASLETATADTYQGKNSLKLDSFGAGSVSVNLIQTSLMKPRYGEDIGGFAQQLIRVVPGSVVTGYATGKWGAAGGGTAILQAWFYDIDGNQVSTVNMCTWSAETTYSPKSGTATVPAGAAFCAIVLSFTSAVGSTKFWIDEIHATAPGASLSNAVGSAARPATL